MRIFKTFPKNAKCPICKTNKNKESTLIAIAGTGDNPNKKFQTYTANVFHIECLDLFYNKNLKVIYQKLKR